MNARVSGHALAELYNDSSEPDQGRWFPGGTDYEGLQSKQHRSEYTGILYLLCFGVYVCVCVCGAGFS